MKHRLRDVRRPQPQGRVSIPCLHRVWKDVAAFQKRETPSQRMKILVCLKQVIAPESDLAIEAGGARIAAPAAAERRLGRYDACALEAALQLRESRADVDIHAVTAGPPEAGEGLRRALGMGADAASHIVSDAEMVDPAGVAAAIASVADSYDLIFAGVMSEDLMQSAVGPALAALLGRPCATAVVSFDVASDGRALTAEEELEHGERHRVRLRLPAVLTFQSGPWLPRYPSLSGLLKARRQTIRALDLKTMPLPATRQNIAAFSPPPRTRQGRILQGTAAEKAAELVHLLQQRGFLPPGGP